MSKDTLRNKLFLPTLYYAIDNIPAYREYHKYIPQLNSYEDISILPIINKKQLILKRQDFCNSHINTFLTQHTSGTSGSQLIIEKGKSEIQFIQQFHAEVYNKLVKRLGMNRQGIVSVYLDSASNGDVVPLGNLDNIIRIKIDSYKFNPGKLITVLERLYIKRANVILISIEENLKYLTDLLISNAYNFDRSPVTLLVSGGFPITKRQQDIYKKTWNVPVAEKYGLTEIYGNSYKNWNEDYFTLAPNVIGEVVDFHTKQPINCGHGILVLTSLYPFSQKQLLIRYCTGDLVEIIRSEHDNPENIKFKLFGRAKSCIIDNYTSAPLLSWISLYNVLDNFPEIATERLSPTKIIGNYTSTGRLKFFFSSERGNGVIRIHLRIGISFLQFHRQSVMHELKKRLESEIINSHPELQRQIMQKKASFNITFIPANTLNGFVQDETI